MEENKENRVINALYKIIMLFVIGCFLGCAFETVLCFIQRGHFESRRGLIYGPLNPVYGVGFLIVCLILKKERRGYMLFLKGFLYGGAIEYAFSWLQEKIFHTSSWNYSNYAFNFDGRTSIYHMMWWGLGTFLVMKFLYPRIIRLIDKVKEKYRLAVIIVISLLLIVDITISTAACIRYTERKNNMGPRNNIDRLMDKYYPDKYLVKIYPNLKDPKTKVKLSKMK